MREERYRFSDDVRATTRAIALRMIHAEDVADSPEALEAWIAGTDDIRERLTKGGFGSAFTVEDLFPLFQGSVGRETSARAEPESKRPVWIWIVAAAGALTFLIGILIATGRLG
jgi:hypothetical protein